MNDDQQPQPETTSDRTDPWSVESNTQNRATSSHVPPVAPMSSAPMAPMAPIEPVGQPVAPGVAPIENPGQTLGIVSIVLGVLMLWLVGLPLAIVSMVKSSKAHASKTLGIVGLVLNVLAIFISGFLFLVVLMAIPALQEAGRNAQAASDAAAVSSTTVTLNENYKPANTEVSFAVPTSYTGWSATTVEKEGINEFTKDDNSATFMTYYGVLAGQVGNDKELTQSAMSEYISQLEAVEVSNSESTVSFPCQSDGKLLEFKTKQVTSTTDGQSLKGIVAVRMYAGHELSVIYLADAEAFSMSEWETLIAQVEIKDGAL